ncbi:hypothetical protein ACS2TZ_48585, partial [Bacillus cereus group sp. Bce025]
MAHARTFLGDLTVSYSNFALPKQVFTTSSTSKKRLREELAKLMFLSCEDKFNLNQTQLKIPNTESWNLLIREIVESAIQTRKRQDNFSA